MADQSGETIGVVVVGMGIAGNFRVRDLKTCQQYPAMKNLRLVGYVSRRQLDIEGAKQITFEEALTDPAVNAIIISTESNLHEEAVRKAILAKKHVCVEFPLTLSPDTTKDLFKLAKEHGVVLHEEDVSLLGATHAELKEKYQAKVAEGAKLVECCVDFFGKYNGWVEDFSRAGTLYMSSIDQIHNMLDLLGDLEPMESVMTVEDDKITALGKLRAVETGTILTLKAARKPAIERRFKVFTGKFDDGSELEVVLSAPKRLNKGAYMMDLEQFAEMMAGQRDGAHTRWICVRGLECANELNALARQNPNSINMN